MSTPSHSRCERSDPARLARSMAFDSMGTNDGVVFDSNGILAVILMEDVKSVNNGLAPNVLEGIGSTSFAVMYTKKNFEPIPSTMWRRNQNRLLSRRGGGMSNGWLVGGLGLLCMWPHDLD